MATHHPQTQAIGRASIVAQLAALPLYDVEDIYVDEASLTSRGLESSQLALAATVIAAEDMAEFINQHAPLIRF